jgi:hypothetical protein
MGSTELTECRMETTTPKHQGILGKKRTEINSNPKTWENMSYYDGVSKRRVEKIA